MDIKVITDNSAERIVTKYGDESFGIIKTVYLPSGETTTPPAYIFNPREVEEIMNEMADFIKGVKND